MIKVTDPINRKKWLAYLGMPNDNDRRLNRQMDQAEQLLKETATIRATYRVMDMKDVEVAGNSIAAHLKGCQRVAVMAVTLGVTIDSLLRKIQVTDMALAVILDCGASLLVEQACDIYENRIRQEVGGYLTPRFSPGYGDYPLEYQQKVIKYIDGPRRIGLNVTADHLLVPRKSVTALIGLSDHPVEGRLATCAECVLREKCVLRNEGKHCGDRF